MDLPKFQRCIGDVWREFTADGKRPAVVADLKIPNSLIDINLAPDKRRYTVGGRRGF